MNIEPTYDLATHESNTRALPPSGDFVGYSSPRRSRSRALTAPDNFSWSSPKKVTVEHHALGLMEAVTPSRGSSALKVPRTPDAKVGRTKKAASCRSFVTDPGAVPQKDVIQIETEVPGKSLKKTTKRRSSGILERQALESNPSSSPPCHGTNITLQRSRSESKMDPPGFLVDEIIYTKETSNPTVTKPKVKRASSKRVGTKEGDDKARLVSPRKRKESKPSTKKPSVTEALQKLTTEELLYTATKFPVTTAIIAADKEKLPVPVVGLPNSLTPKSRSELKVQQRRGSDMTSTTQASSTSRSGSAENDDPARTGRIKSPTRRQRTLSKGCRDDALAWMNPRKTTTHPISEMSGLLAETTAICSSPKRALSEKSSVNHVSPTKRVGRVSRASSTRSRLEKSTALFESSPLDSSFDDDEMTVMTWTRVAPDKQNSKSSLEMVVKKTSKEAKSGPTSPSKQVRATIRPSIELRDSDASHFTFQKPTKGPKAGSHNLLPLDFTEFQPEDFSTVEFEDPVALVPSNPSNQNRKIQAEGHDSFWSLTALHDG